MDTKRTLTSDIPLSSDQWTRQMTRCNELANGAPLAKLSFGLGAQNYKREGICKSCTLPDETWVLLVNLVNQIPSLELFRLKKETGNSWEYFLRLHDGRIWRQTINMDQPSDPLLTFNIPAGWRMSEFFPHRLLRDGAIALIVSHGAMGLTELRIELA